MSNNPNNPIGSRPKVLVLGATGGIGSEVARQLRDQGWEVVAMHRNAAQAREQRDGFTWVQGDAMTRADVMAAATGCQVIVHAVNPPGYRRWSELVLPMIDNTIAAARAHGATVVLPGTVYNYGPEAFPVLHEDAPNTPARAKAPCGWSWNAACSKPPCRTRWRKHAA